MRVAVAGGTGLTGRTVVEALEAEGHAAVVLSRGEGVDLTTGHGLDEKLAGVEAVVDVSNKETLSRQVSEDFFGAVTATLLAAEKRVGVRHHVVLSIVGADEIDYPYYMGKRLQEEKVRNGGVPWTILRATQFHEFALQSLRRVPGPIIVAPKMLSQPVAVREVGRELAVLAAGAPLGMAREIAGPRREQMVDMVRATKKVVGRRGVVVPVRLPGEAGKLMAEGGLVPKGDGPRGKQSFAQWLTTIAEPAS